MADADKGGDDTGSEKPKKPPKKKDKSAAGPRPAPPRKARGPLPDVVVAGGGIIGLAIARELARHKVKVEVLERGERRGGTGAGEASTAAAGMLAPFTETPVPGHFFEACRDSRNRWAAFCREIELESGLTVDYDDSGSLLCALDEEDEEHLAGLRAVAGRLGEPADDLPLSEARRRVPDLSKRVRRCLHLPGDHRVDNVKAMAALSLAAESAGVTLTLGRRLDRVKVGPDSVHLSGEGWERDCGLLVVAAGAWSRRIRGLPQLPVYPVRGQMALVSGVDWDFGGIVRGPDLYTVRRGTRGLLVGATVERVGFENHTTVAGTGRLMHFLRRLLPGLAHHRLEATWAGLRPGTPDELPLLGPLVGDLKSGGSFSGPTVLAATGHYRNGVLLAPWTAHQVAAMVLDGEVPPGVRGFSPHRFGDL